MRWTLHVKLALGLAGVLTVIMGLSLLMVTLRARHRVLENYQHFALHVSDVAEAGLESAMLSRSSDEIMSVLQAINRREGIENVLIFDRLGEIKFSVQAEDVGRVLAMDDPTCRLCHDRSPADQTQTVIFTPADGERILRVAQPILNQPRCQGCHQGRLLGVLVTDFSLAEADRQVASTLGELFLWVLVTMAGVIGAAIGLVYLLVTRPLGHFVKVTRAVGEGELSRRVGLARKDEIGELAASFDHMVQRVAVRAQELEALNAVAATASRSLDLEEMLHQALERVCQVTETEWGAVHLIDDRTDELVLAAACGLPAPAVEQLARLKRGQSFAGQVAESGEPLVVEDPTSDPRGVAEVEGLQSLAVVPLRSGRRVVGAMGTGSATRHRFTSREVELFQAMGYQVAVAIDNARLYAAEKRRAAHLALLNEVGREVLATLQVDELLRRVADAVWRRFGYYNVCILLLDPGTGKLVSRGVAGIAREATPRDLPVEIGQSIVGRVAATGETYLANDVTRDPYYFGLPGLETRAELCVPIEVGGEVAGVLNVESRQKGAFGEMDVHVMEILADQLAAALENARLYERTQRLAVTDPLTGLGNRRVFQERLEEELRRSRRYEHPLSVIMADIDHFKVYNDTHGHPAGDKVLEELAGLLRANVRETDFVARYGGEEFVVLLPETTREGTLTVAEKLRAVVEHHPFPQRETQPGGRLTISLGVATFPEDLEEPAALVRSADQALYEAKEMGRNRVE